MNQFGFPLLSLIVWLPALGALVLLALPKGQEQLVRTLTMIFAALTFACSCVLIFAFDTSEPGMQFVDQLAWIPDWGISYMLGVDGISLWLVVLTTFIMPVALLSAWDSVHTQIRYFHVLALLLETAMLGVFLAIDTFLFYLFWEFSLIPMAFMIGIWGGGNRLYAAVKFFLYTFAGSVLMLLAIIALSVLHQNATGAMNTTFSLTDILNDMRQGAFVLDTTTARWLFGAFFIAFAIKVPLWPFHTWLPDAHVEAPTAGSIILAGVLLKLGTYGLIRFNLALFPEAARWAAPAIGVLAVIGILYGAAVAFAQSDMKKLVAYSSVSHMGFVVLGIFALNLEGISGAVLQMVSHGLSTGALFFIVGVVYERYHTREIADYGGLWTTMPIYGSLTLVMVLSSAGLPGLNGFIGEFTIMQGAFLSRDLGWPFVAFAVIGVILAAVYLMRMFQGAFMGEPANHAHHGEDKPQDVNPRELTALLVLLVPVVAIGLFPVLFFEPMQTSIANVVDTLDLTVIGSR